MGLGIYWLLYGTKFFSTADYPNALEFDVDTNLSYEYVVIRLDERCPDIRIRNSLAANGAVARLTPPQPALM